MSEHKMSSFLTNFVRREKELPKTAQTGMPSTDDLASTLVALRDDALQVHHDYRSTTQDIEGRIGRLSTRISSLYPVLSTVHRAYVETSTRANALEQEFDALKKDHHTVAEDLADHKIRLADRIRQVEALIEEREQLRADVDRLEKETSELRQLREGLAFELNASRRRTEGLDRRLVELEDEKGNRDNAYFEARRTVARLTNDFGETRLALEARNSAYDEMKTLLGAEQARYAKAISEHTRTTNECQSLCSQLGHLEKEHTASRKRYEAQIERMAIAVSEVERDRDAARGRLAVTEKINGSQRRKIERAHEHISYLQAAMRRLIDEKRVENAPPIDLDYDFDRDGTQLDKARDHTGEPASEVSAKDVSEEFETRQGVIKLPARRTK